MGLKTLADISFFQKFDFLFWTRAAQIIEERPKQVAFILWLEPGPKISVEKYINLKEKLLSYFKKNPILPEGVNIAIHNRSDQIHNFNIEVDST